MRNPKDYILLYLKGLCMGGADVIPGVSGGTIAFITGIYDELVHSLRSFDRQAFYLLRRLRLADFWQKINGNFLITVFAGIITSILSLAKGMLYLLEVYPIQTWSFFFGLIMVSSLLTLRTIRKWNVGVVLSFIVGVVIAYIITILSPTQTPEGLWFIFLAGALAICAVILPGLSVVFILLLFSKYEYMIRAFHQPNIPVVILFVLGCFIGLVLFSRFLSWLLNSFHHLTIALLAGFMIGSLNKVWPWKEVLSYRLDSNGKQVPAFDHSIFPGNYVATTGKDPRIFQAILLMALGVLIVILIEKIAERLKTKI